MQFDRSQCLYLGKVGSIPLFAHWTFLFLIYMALNLSAGGNAVNLTSGIIYLIVLVTAIVLHELGHGLAAQAQGAHGVTITLWAFGGLCSSTRDALPRREIIILAAGPIVSFLLAWGAYITLKALLAGNPALLVEDEEHVRILQYYFSSNADASFQVLIGKRHVIEGSLIGQLLALTMYVNLVLGIFNIMPIYPLDGGQIVYHVNRLYLKEAIAAKVSLALAVIAGFSYVGWRMYTDPEHQFPLYLAILITYLIFNAFRYLR
jgi:Zn-dependent protease